MKVMGIRVDDEFYYEKKEKFGSPTVYLRRVIDFYENYNVNAVNTAVNGIKRKRTYSEISELVDALIDQNKSFFEDSNKKSLSQTKKESFERHWANENKKTTLAKNEENIRRANE